MVDRELVTRKMVLIAEDLRRLEVLARKSRRATTTSPSRRFRGSGALEAEFARRLAPCAGLRNRIVHVYDDLDPGRVYDSLRSALLDVPAYLTAIRSFLESRTP